MTRRIWSAAAIWWKSGENLSLVQILPSNRGDDQKIKKGLHHNLLLTFAVILDLLELSAIFLFNVQDAFFWWVGGAKSRWGTLHLDGGDVSPYNLSTACHQFTTLVLTASCIPLYTKEFHHFRLRSSSQITRNCGCRDVAITLYSLLASTLWSLLRANRSGIFRS